MLLLSQHLCFLSQSKLALCACNHRFLAVTEEGKLMAVSEKASDREMITVSARVARTASPSR